jgi:glycine cleavage system H lipoate-binding protein
MTALLDLMESMGILVVGVLVRLLVTLAMLALLALPILGVLKSWQWLARLRAGAREVGGMPWRRRLYYAPGHAWLKWGRGSQARVGIDGLAARIVSDVDRVELPRVGTTLSQGALAARLHCGERQAPVLAPVEGRVTRVNDAVRQDPTLLSTDPYGRGWLYAVETSSPEPALPHGGPAQEWFQREGDRLTRWLEHDLGLAAADGGELVGPAPSLVKGERWAALTDAFLKVGPREPQVPSR